MDIHPDFEYSIHGDLLLYAVIPVTIGFSTIPKYTGKSTLLQMWGHFILSTSWIYVSPFFCRRSTRFVFGSPDAFLGIVAISLFQCLYFSIDTEINQSSLWQKALIFKEKPDSAPYFQCFFSDYYSDFRV
jgi:hypothetical protein